MERAYAPRKNSRSRRQVGEGGSTNLNIASWIGNYELDVAVEDEHFADAMEEMYLEDLAKSTEIVLGERGVRTVQHRPAWSVKQRKRRAAAMSRAGAGAIRIGSAVSAAMTNHRVLGPTEAQIMAVTGVFVLALSSVLVLWPKWVGILLAVLGTWLGVSLLIRGYRLFVIRRSAGDDEEEDRGDSPSTRDGSGYRMSLKRRMAYRSRRDGHSRASDSSFAHSEGSNDGRLSPRGSGLTDPLPTAR